MQINQTTKFGGGRSTGKARRPRTQPDIWPPDLVAGGATIQYVSLMDLEFPLTFASMDAALLGIVGTLLREGLDASPRGAPTSEVLGHTFRLSNPRARRIALPARRWKESLAVGELCWHLSQSDAVEVLTYYTPAWEQFSEDGRRIASSCYGKRIFAGAERSQWHQVRAALKNDPATRRAVIILADTSSDLTSAKDVSCLTAIQFLLRDGALHCLTTMRSCDVIWGLCYDVYLCTMLQELMAAQLGVQLGWYQHSSGSLHLYEGFASMAADIERDGLMTVAPPMPPMEHLEAVPDFLAAEAALRTNQSTADTAIAALPAYWRDLVVPLQRLRARRWQRPVSR